MNILTIGNSPYLLDSYSKINRDLLVSLKNAGHRIGSLVFNHDIKYFLPDELFNHNFDHNGKTICPLFPFLKHISLAAFIMQVLRSAQPNVVISIGNYSEIQALAAVKAKYRKLFKWIAILPFGGDNINDNYRLDLEMADCIVATNSASAKEYAKLVQTEVQMVEYGPDHNVFYPLGLDRKQFGVAFCGKNNQLNAIASIIKAASIANIYMGLHYNCSDDGEYDIDLLIRRFKLENHVKRPNKYISLRDGVEECELNNYYNNYDAVIGCSSQSSTALSMLEAMATGCIPIGVNFGSEGEIISQLPKEFQFFVPYSYFIGPKEEGHAVVSADEIAKVFLNMKQLSADRYWLAAARQASASVAKNFSKDMFTKRINDILEYVVFKEHAIVVDSF